MSQEAYLNRVTPQSAFSYGLAALLMLALVAVVWWQNALVSGSSGPSIVIFSPLLEADLPGLLPHPQAEAVQQELQGEAMKHHQRCLTSETYQVSEQAVMQQALEDAFVSGHYQQAPFKYVNGRSVVALYGPNRLLLVQDKQEILLCLLDAELTG